MEENCGLSFVRWFTSRNTWSNSVRKCETQE